MKFLIKLKNIFLWFERSGLIAFILVLIVGYILGKGGYYTTPLNWDMFWSILPLIIVYSIYLAIIAVVFSSKYEGIFFKQK